MRGFGVFLNIVVAMVSGCLLLGQALAPDSERMSVGVSYWMLAFVILSGLSLMALSDKD